MKKTIALLVLFIFLASCAKTPLRRPYPISSNSITVGLKDPGKIHGIIKNPYAFELEAAILIKGYDQNDRLILVEDITGVLMEPYGHTIFEKAISTGTGSNIAKLEVIGKGKKPIEQEVVEESK